MLSKNETVNRTYRSTVFGMVFQEKPALLSLYNAMNGTDYKDPELLTINTLKNAIYMSIHNDISFLIDFRLNLYEHQSTDNPNLPLRFLMYVADLYSVLTKDKNLYGTKRIPLPTPQFIVFYNGWKQVPEEQILKLSASFLIPETEPSLELIVRVLNINAGHNQKLLNDCRDLREYAEYTHRVRTYAETFPLEEAVELAITECIHEGILKEFLEKHRLEAKKMSIYEYDAEKHMRMEREECTAEGRAQGMKEGIKQGVQQGLRQSNELTLRLLEAKRYEDLERAAREDGYQKRLLEEFGIS